MQRLLALVLVGLSGCAATVIPTGDANEVVGPQRHAAADRQGPATIIVKRNRAFTGVLCGKQVLLNGQPVADLAGGQKVTFGVPAGRQLLGVRTIGPCPGSQKELAVDVVAGERRTFLVDVAYAGDLVLSETAF